jgi:outer membrane protein OmpA-like peptidoglycan-associated protein
MKSGRTASLLFCLALFGLAARAQPATGPVAGSVADSTRFVVSPLRCNTAQSEFLPAFYGEQLYFMRAKSPASKLSVLRLRWPAEPRMYTHILPHPDSSKAPKRVMVNILHSKYMNFGVANHLRGGKQIAFTRGLPLDKSGGSSHALGIYFANAAEQVWYNVEAFSGNRFPFSVAHPALTSDGKSLYFASDAPGGLGGSDLYVCHQDSAGKWGKPQNLGPRINTPGHEMYPFVHEDGTLYFASDRAGGLGGFDVYEAVRSRHSAFTFIRAVRMSAPINSPYHDFGFIVNEPKRMGYFSSDRPGGQGGYDLYRVDIKLLHHSRNITDGGDGVFGHVPLELTGIVLDSATSEPLPRCVVKLRDFNQDDIQIGYTDKLGRYRFSISNENKYQIAASKVGYQTSGDQQLSTYGVKEKMEMNVDLVLAPMAYKLTLKLAVTEQAGSEAEAAAIPWATIRLEDVTNGQARSLQADSLGQLTITLDQGKIYKVSALAEGFRQGLPYRVSTTNTTNSRTLEINLPLAKDNRPPKLRDQKMVLVRVKDAQTDQPIAGADVRFHGLAAKNPPKATTNAQGLAWVAIDTVQALFRLEALSPGHQMADFLPADPSSTLPGDTLALEVALPASKHPPVPLDLAIAPVFYPTGESLLPASVQKSLGRVVELLQRYPSLKIKVLAHTDQRLAKAAGQALSRRRAVAVANFLAQHKIARQRVVKAEGLGRSQPRHDCLAGQCSEQQRRENRRVEFEIVGR